MELVTGQQMRRIDERAIARGTPSLELMEHAGRGIAAALRDDYPDLATRGVLVVCGKGNNGGDGFVAARALASRGIVPRVVLLGRASEVSPDAAANLAALRAAGVVVHEAPDIETWREHAHDRTDEVVLDAMLGTGVTGGARGLVAQVIDDLNAGRRTVVAIDLPSGLDADSPTVAGPAIRATRTYTLCRPKLPLALEPAASLAGVWRVVPIGIPDEIVAEEQVALEWLDRDVARALLPARRPDTHKGTYGHLLAVAGSADRSGAAVLLARGALRAGVGLVTVATPRSARRLVAVQQAEAMTVALDETAAGTIAATAVDAVETVLGTTSALAIGPGLGTEPDAVQAVLGIIGRAERPLVIDADGLNALATLGTASLARLLARCPPFVLTPHPGEAARLLGRGTADIQADRLASAREIARTCGGTVVLKGHRTIVARADGRAAVNASGNPGMASGGTGDVLTGIVGAFLARRLDTWDAARLAVYVHGAAGDHAAAHGGLDGLIASDVAGALPTVLAGLQPAAEVGR
jgi:NAD(P)H-hydrate epimerase